MAVDPSILCLCCTDAWLEEWTRCEVRPIVLSVRRICMKAVQIARPRISIHGRTGTVVMPL